jgi:TP901 family phage tail tape measure protein
VAGRYSIETIFKAIDKMSGPVAKMEARINGMIDRTNRRLAAVGAVPNAMLSGMQTLGAAAMAAAVPVGMLAKSVIEVGAGYEQAITNVGAVMLKSRSEIADLDAEAKRLGATTKFTATEAAQGMELMARAGFTNQEILAGMSGVLAAAAAEGVELAVVADHVSNVLKGMALPAGEASRVADVLALASSKTNSSLSSLGESMANVSSTARELGVPLESVVASVALLQDVGLDASVAGSAVNTMLTKLAAPTGAVKAQLKQMGVAFADANGNALPFAEILRNLAKGGGKAGGSMGRVAFFADLVGLRGQKAASNLATMFETIDEATGKNKFETLVDALEQAQGSARKMADIRMQTAQGDWLLLWSAIDAVRVSLFETQGAPLRGMIQGTTEWVSANQELIKTKFVEYVEKTRENLPEIVKWVKRIGVTIGVLVAWSAAIKVATMALMTYKGVVAAYTLVVGGLAVLSKVYQALSLAQSAWVLVNYATAGSLTAIAVAAIPVVLAIGAIAAAVYELVKLLDVLEGYSVFSLIGDIATGKGISGLDEHQNKLAKQRRAQADAAAKVDSDAASRVSGGAGTMSALESQFANLDALRGVLTGGGSPMIANWDGATQQTPAVASVVDLASIQLPPTKVEASGEITIRDETGRAEVTKKPKQGGVPLKLKPTGSY